MCRLQTNCEHERAFSAAFERRAMSGGRQTLAADLADRLSYLHVATTTGASPSAASTTIATAVSTPTMSKSSSVSSTSTSTTTATGNSNSSTKRYARVPPIDSTATATTTATVVLAATTNSRATNVGRRSNAAATASTLLHGKQPTPSFAVVPQPLLQFVQPPPLGIDSTTAAMSPPSATPAAASHFYVAPPQPPPAVYSPQAAAAAASAAYHLGVHPHAPPHHHAAAAAAAAANAAYAYQWPLTNINFIPNVRRYFCFDLANARFAAFCDDKRRSVSAICYAAASHDENIAGRHELRKLFCFAMPKFAF